MTSAHRESPSRTTVVAIASPTQGAARTTTAVNLAIALAAAGQTVLLVDLDPQGHASKSLVRGRYELEGIYRVLKGAVITRDMITATEFPDLYLIPADEALGNIEIELSLVGDGRTRLYQGLETLSAITPHFDSVIVDCPSSLGLITLNALSAAHRVLLLVPADYSAMEELPVFLKAINRLRAGSSRPLRGVHILVTLIRNLQTQLALIAELRRTYYRMSLQTEIPWSQTVDEAAAQRKPVLAYALRSKVSQAYLALAAEWLSLESPIQGGWAGLWPFKARQEFIARRHQEIQHRIEAWLMDPTSLLFDANESTRHAEAQVLEELFSITRQMNRLHFPIRRLAWVTLMTLTVAVPLALVALSSQRSGLVDTLWLEAGTLLIDTDHYWRVGSTLLARSDEAAYRELVLATQLVEMNRVPLHACLEQARQNDSVVICAIHVEHWR